MLSFLFGKKEKGNDVSQDSEQRGGISYDAQLIHKLKEDHQELVKIFTEIKQAAFEGRYSEIPSILADFKLALQTHLAVENVRFYVYVQQSYAHDVDTSDFVTGLRTEMNGIARVVMKFIEKHTATPPVAVTVVGFVAELEEIGAVLVRRIQLEESRLYSLYRPA